jgi:hypothetical protein
MIGQVTRYFSLDLVEGVNVVKKCLIAYSSYTGNTEKVALRFKDVLEDRGWDVDVFKVRKNADDILRPPYDIRHYDFFCIGSGLRGHLPYNEILNLLRGVWTKMDPRITMRFRDETLTYLPGPVPPIPPDRIAKEDHGRIVLGPDSPRAVVFVTYAGYEFGPREADPAARLLALEVEHIGYECIGRFTCPGKYLDDPTPRTYLGDIRDRPNERDLIKARIFMEEKLEEIAGHDA